MGEVLSQNEIDELLKALNTGELDVEDYRASSKEKQIKEYDFARPSKFAKEHLRTLEIIFEHYARLMSTTLPAYLRSSIQIDVINSEAVSYSEFSNALSNPILLGIIDFNPLKGNIIFDFSVNVAFAIIDRLLGGKGEMLEKHRDFSEIEIVLMEKIMVICINLLREPFKNVVEVRPRLDKIETNSQFAQIISPNEVIALVTLNFKMGNVEGLMNICIPYLSLEPIIDKLNTKFWFSSMQQVNQEYFREFIEKQIASAHIPLRALLGKAQISVNDFIELQVGDIIKLDTSINDEILLTVGNLDKFGGKAGIYNGHVAFRIGRVLKEEE